MTMPASVSFAQRHSLWLAVALSVLLSLLGLHLWVDELFVTFMHEASHGLAAILTGGRLASFTISPDASGLAFTVGGFRPLVLTAGYAGSCLWGGVLLVAARKPGWEKTVLFVLSGFLLAFTVLFVRNFFGFGVGLALGAFFGWAGYKGKGWQLSLLLSFLAVQSSMFALKDLSVLIRAGTMPVTTDASLMSRELTFGLVPPLVCAVGIAAIAVVIFVVFLRIALDGELKQWEDRLEARQSA
jgi:hypothetical protein